MRLPKRRKTRELNRAYAFVMSDEFGKAAASLTDGLKKRGFDEVEAFKAVEEQLPLQNDFGELFNTPPDVVRLGKSVLDGIVLPDEIRKNDFANGDGEIVLSGKESDDVIEQVAVQLSKSGNPEAAHLLKLKHQQKKAAVAKPVPAKTTTWRFPRLVANVDGMDLFSADQAYETVGKTMPEYLPRTLNKGEISVEETGGKTFILKLDGNQMTSSFSSDSSTGYLKGFSGKIEESDVVNVLDGMMKDCMMLLQAERRHWLASVIADLHRNHGISCEQLVLIRYQLRSRLEWHYLEALGKARREAYQQVFALDTPHKLALDLPGGFVFDEHIYEGNTKVYRGAWRFNKHFLGTYAIPQFDGKREFGEGEEFECAKHIDANPKVVSWLRNRDSDPRSFRLPMGGKTDWFYPDFIGELDDGRLFALEYKGSLTGQSEDTVEKDAIGKLWAAQDPKKYVYATIYGDVRNGMSPERQVNLALA